MSLQFIYGRAGSGKTFYCLNEIKSRNESANRKVLLVPEQYTFQAERDLINVLQTGGILKTEVLSFRRMAYRVFNEVGGITYPHIHSAGKCMIIYRILDKLRDQLKTFSKSSDRRGFVNTIATLITEFKRYNIYPEQLEGIVAKLEDDNIVKDKINELKLIYLEFENTIKTQYRDADDELTQLSIKLDDTTMYDGAEIWIDGFGGFTPQEYAVIEKLMIKASKVCITMSTDILDDENIDLTDVFSTTKISYKKFMRLAYQNNITVEKPIGLNSPNLPRFAESRELQSLESNYFAYPYKNYIEPTKDVELFESINIYAEIEECARDIIRQCRDNGLRYKDIAVVTRNLEGYQRLVEVVFEEYGIPHFVDAKTEISNHPLVRLVLSMLDIFVESWSYESVFRYLKSGLTGVENYKIDILENYVLACGIRGSRWTANEDWNMSPELMPSDKQDDEKDKLLIKINEARIEVSAPLIKFRSKIKGRKKASEICSNMYEFLLDIGVVDRIEQYITKFKLDGNLRLASEYEQVWNILMDVFDQTVEVMGEETIGIERFANVIKIGLAEYKISSIPVSLDQVLVGSIEHSKSHEIKALYIIGVNDGVFPSAGMSEGILTDADRKCLNSNGVELASDTKTQAFDEQFLIYNALTTPKNFLRISWPIADHEGKTMRPSSIILRMRKLFPNIVEKSNILKPIDNNDQIMQLSAQIPAFKQLVTAMRECADGNGICSLWNHVYKWYSHNIKWADKCKLILEAFEYKNIAEPVSNDKIQALYGSNVYSSVSRLEKYTTCPFAYYIQYGLGAKERKIYRLSPPDVGTFMHAVIERFSKMVEEKEISWRELEREWCTKQVEAIVDELLGAMKNSGLASSKRFKALMSRLKRVITRSVWLIAEHIKRSNFYPIGYEMDFAEDGKLPPIVIELDSGQKVTLVGRIDRVDALQTEDASYLRIVDYKSGDKDFKLSDVYYGLQMQLITYLDALWENGTNQSDLPVYPGGMLYFKVDDPIVKGTNMSSPEEIEIAIMKKLKMKGLLLADVRLIKEMDNTIEGNSLIIPARINTGDVLGKSSSATLEQFSVLRTYVKKLLKELCTEIMRGNVSIKPYKKKKATSCQYCSYSSVCQFDAGFKESSFNLLHDKDDEEVWCLMSEVKE